MPIYSYRCPDCGRTETMPRPIALRDTQTHCPFCYYVEGKSVLCERIADAPNFTVTGFNAKNGYSK